MATAGQLVPHPAGWWLSPHFKEKELFSTSHIQCYRLSISWKNPHFYKKTIWQAALLLAFYLLEQDGCKYRTWYKVWVRLGSLYINTGESLDVPVHTLKEKYLKWSLTARNLCQIICNVLCSSLAHLHSRLLSQVRVCPLAHFIGWLIAKMYTFLMKDCLYPCTHTHTHTNFQEILAWLVTTLMALPLKGR